MERCMAPLLVMTRGQLPGGTRPGIDHIAASDDLQAARVWSWPSEVGGRQVSDHEGAGADLTAAS